MHDHDADATALFARHVTGTGFDAPRTYAELLLFVELSGTQVFCQQSAPPDFDGIQIGEAVFVDGSSRQSDRGRMLILAHEWCHCLRRRDALADTGRARFYRSGDLAEFRSREEEIARAFERLF